MRQLLLAALLVLPFAFRASAASRLEMTDQECTDIFPMIDQVSAEIRGMTHRRASVRAFALDIQSHSRLVYEQACGRRGLPTHDFCSVSRQDLAQKGQQIEHASSLTDEERGFLATIHRAVVADVEMVCAKRLYFKGPPGR